MTVRTRFAPSPTGLLHVGGARTALFSWLHARRHGGCHVLRIEDTDRERSTAESVDAILHGLEWLGLDCDEGPYFQSERFDLYRRYLARLLDGGLAYRCYCSREELDRMREAQRARGDKPRYDGRCRGRTAPPPPGIDPVIRFANPTEGEVVVEDSIRGRMVFANAELDDLVIARPDGTPTYNFTVVVDDLEMGVTDVIRGDDHINNTPRQINILRALGAEPPRYAHVPMILGPDGQRFSKRHGAVGVLQFRDDGYLPEALVNYLVRLGWSHGDQEIFGIEELRTLFDVHDVNRAASVFDYDKLNWLNQHYIREADASRLAAELEYQLRLRDLDPDAGPPLETVVEIQRERAQTLAEMAEKSRFAFTEIGTYDEKAAAKHLRADAADPLCRLGESLAALEVWEPDALQEVVVKVAEECAIKLGKLAQPLRVALTGSAASPSIESTLVMVGRERSLARIANALERIAGSAALP